MNRPGNFNPNVESNLDSEELVEETKKSEPSILMKWVVPLLMFGGIFGFIAHQYLGAKAANAAWVNEFDQGLDSSKQTGKPLVVLFTADWCPSCQDLKNETLSRSDVADALKADFTPVRVDLTNQGGENNKIAQTFGVHSIPTVIMFDVKGQQVDRFSGAMPGSDFLQWLANHKVKAMQK